MGFAVGRKRVGNRRIAHSAALRVIAVEAEGRSTIVRRRLTSRDLPVADRAVAGLTGLEASRRAAGPQSPVTVRIGQVAQPSPNDVIALVPVSFGGQSGATGTGQAVANIRSDAGRALAGSGLRAQLTGEAAAGTDNAATGALATMA